MSNPTRICPQCHAEIARARGVCPECGHVTTWFKIRLGCGTISIIIALLGMLTMLILALRSGG